MAVTITKNKAATKGVSKTKEVKVEVETDPGAIEALPLTRLADLYGELQDKVTALQLDPVFQQFANVQKELKERLAASLQPTETTVINGKHYDLEVGVSAKSPRAVEDKEAVLKMLGLEVFVQVAKIGVTDAQKYLTGEQLDSVCNAPGYTGNRKIVAKFKG